MSLYQEIHKLFSGSGPVDREILIPILLALLERLKELEERATS